MRIVRRHRLVSILLLLGFLLVGCQPTSGLAVTPMASLPPTEALASQPVEAPTSPATIEAGASPTARPLRTALEASDPNSVSLANGRPTLVEFFAFW